MRLAYIGAASLLAACASTGPDPRTQMVGASEQTISQCLGEPASKETQGRTQVWTYYTPDFLSAAASAPASVSLPLRGSTARAHSAKDACVVLVKIEQSKVTAVDYENSTDAQQDATCATAIERCPRTNALD